MVTARRESIMFVTPPYHAGVVESAGRWMPLSYAYLASVAREEGYQARIYDAMTKQHTLAEVAATLEREQPDIVGVTAITATIPAALDVLRVARKANPKVRTILGGVHPTFCYDELFAEHGGLIDVIVKGEGEVTLRNLLRRWAEGKSIADVRGIAFREAGSVRVTLHQPFVPDLDSIKPAWDLFDWEDYRYFVIPDSRLAAINTSRGCTHGCTFCSQQEFWQKTWRCRRPEHLVEEIRHLKTSYGANVVLLTDEYPTLERDRWEEFLDRLIQADLGV